MCIVSYAVMKKIFGRHVHQEGEEVSSSLEKLMGPDFSGYLKDREEHRKVLTAMPFEKIQILSEDGISLAAHYYRNPDGNGRTAVMIHGHSSNGFEGYAATGLAYIRHGYSILLPDSRACGESGGKWCTFGILERYDIMKWIQYLNGRIPEDQIVLHGCSLGGASVCLCAGLDLPENVKAIVSDCAFADIHEQLKYMVQVTAHIPSWMILPEVLQWFHHETGLSVNACSPLEAVRRAEVPMMFIHGAEDHYVLPENAGRLYDACGSEKKLLMIEGAGHAAARYKGKEKYDQPLFQFLDQHTEEQTR